MSWQGLLNTAKDGLNKAKELAEKTLEQSTPETAADKVKKAAGGVSEVLDLAKKGLEGYRTAKETFSKVTTKAAEKTIELVDKAAPIVNQIEKTNLTEAATDLLGAAAAKVKSLTQNGDTPADTLLPQAEEKKETAKKAPKTAAKKTKAAKPAK